MDWAAIITACTGAIALIGAGLRFVWGQVITWKREVDAKLDRCEARERHSEERRATLVTVIELLWGAVKRHEPDSHELHRADKLMQDYKAIGSEP